MTYYCIMVLTGEEKKFIERAKEIFKDDFSGAKFYFFERKMHTKKRGWFLGALFPGYVFFGAEELTPEFFLKLRSVKGFCKILPDNQNPLKFMGTELEELEFLIQTGGVLGISKIQFMPEKKLKVISGPLKGYEGQIVSVNKKRKRITVRSFLTPDGKTFDLNFEEAELVE